MSNNEWRKSQEDPSNYEVQFWGGIDLNRPVAEEYAALRQRGYPVVLRDLPALSAAGRLAAFPDRWRVSASAPD